MRIIQRQASLFVLPALFAFCSYGQTASFGVATALANYSVSDHTVSGATPITPGATLSTTISTSEVRLDQGTELLLATHSSGTLYKDRLVLHDGAVRVNGFQNYPITAGGLKIEAEEAHSQAVVRLNGKVMEVAALGGGLRVSDGGARLIRVAAGTHSNFDAQSDTATTQTGASSAQTGAPKQPHKGLDTGDTHALLWSIVVFSAGAAVIGSVAAAEGKSPF